MKTETKLTCTGCGRRTGTVEVLSDEWNVDDGDLLRVTMSNVPRKGLASGLTIHATRAVTARLSDGAAPDGPWPLTWPCDHCDHTCSLDRAQLGTARTVKV